ncbi:MAG TPA: hypothetical protein ENK86_05840, partial [Campylobacterales bacterium]|nr:hypothetical protein [Campylobacterales bacterium]
KSSGASHPFDGDMDEIKIFTEALNANAIAQIYRNEKSGKNWDGSLREDYETECQEEEEEGTATCYAMTDNNSKIYAVTLKPGASKLPTPKTFNISRTFDGEGSAYRASNHTLYAFDEGRNSDLYSIDLGNEVYPITKVKNNLLGDNIEGMEFYYDPVLDKEILYVIQSETGSQLHAFYADSWESLKGYPKRITGATQDLSSLAINPLNGEAYGVDDYNYDKVKPTVYKLDLKTGKTSYLTQLEHIIDAEGLAFANDGNLYVEDEVQWNGRKIYRLDLETGALTPAAELGGSGDVEGLSCNGIAMVMEKPVINLSSDQNITEGNASVRNLEFTVTLDKPSETGVTFAWQILDGNTSNLWLNATQGEDYNAIATPTTVTLQGEEQSYTITVPIIGDETFEADEQFHVVLSAIENAIAGKTQAMGTILNDDQNITEETAQPIGCVDTAFMFQNKPTDISALDLTTGEMRVVAENIWNDNINAAGYNVKDGYFWGYNHTQSNGLLTRMGQNEEGDLMMEEFQVKNLSIKSYVGDIDSNGHLYLKERGNSKNISVIDLDPDSETYLTEIRTLKLSQNLTTADWGFNPKDKLLYAVNNGAGTNYLYQIDPETGKILSKKDTKLSGNYGFGAGFFDKNGFYYVYDNRSGTIFRIDVQNSPEAVPFSTSSKVSLNDGAMCPNVEIAFDFGDLPENYATTLANDGARHRIKTSVGKQYYLGEDVSTEEDGQPSDDANADAHDDGVKVGVGFMSTPLQGYEIKSKASLSKLTITTHGEGYLNAWIDWDRDGNFTREEQIAQGVDGSSGVISLTILPDAIPSIDFNGEPIYARFRYSSASELNATGPAPDGEVEDYRMETPKFPSVHVEDIAQREGDEGLTEFRFTVTIDRSGNCMDMMQSGFYFSITEGTATLGDKDYLLPAKVEGATMAVGGFVGVMPNVDSFDIIVQVQGDETIEANEQFFLNLYSPDFMRIAKNQAVATIINDDEETVRLSVERINSTVVDNATQARKESLYTQIAGRDFDYAIAAYNEDNQPKAVRDLTVKVELLDASDKVLYSHLSYIDSAMERFNVVNAEDLKLMTATQKAYYRISHPVDENGSILHGDYRNAPERFNPNAVQVYYSSDDFVIRPAAFDLELFFDKNKLSDNRAENRIDLYAENDYVVNGYAVGYESQESLQSYANRSADELNVTLLFDDQASCPATDNVPSNHDQKSFDKGQLKSMALSHNNVGKYSLTMNESVWTLSDQEEGDCLLGSSSNEANEEGKVGCDIGAEHLNLTFHPYQFGITTELTNSTGTSNNYLYMADVESLDRMGLRLQSTIEAQGKEGTALSNFHHTCAAEDVDLRLDYSITSQEGTVENEATEIMTIKETPLSFLHKVTAVDTGTLIEQGEANLTTPLSIGKQHFTSEHGSVTLESLYTLEKHYSEPSNPIQLTLKALNAMMPVTIHDEATSIAGIGDIAGSNRRFFYTVKVASESENYGDTTKKQLITPLSVL